MRNLLCAENPNLAPRITQIWAAIRNTCATGCILPFIRQLNSSFKTYQAFFSSLISQYFLPLSLLACQSSDCVLALKGGARRRRPHLLREYSISEKHACCWPLWFIACYEWPRPAAVSPGRGPWQHMVSWECLSEQMSVVSSVYSKLILSEFILSCIN